MQYKIEKGDQSQQLLGFYCRRVEPLVGQGNQLGTIVLDKHLD